MTQTQTQVLPRAAGRSTGGDGVAPVRGNREQVVQTVLFAAGAVLLPLGLVVILLGWVGASRTPYQYDQLSYLISGGVFGLGLTFCGGFLYFGAWLARIATEQRVASRQLAESLRILAEAFHQSRPAEHHAAPVGSAASADLVVTPGGNTLHRSDCPLLADRQDLRPAGQHAAGLIPCRICKPEPVA
jgi:hypothetical protein